MISELKPYPEVKDSGVDWLGDLPAHWDTVRFKHLLQERNTRSKEGSEQLLRVSQYTGVSKRTADTEMSESNNRAASLVGYKCVQPRDLVVNIMLAWNGSLGVSKFSGIVSPAYCVYRFKPNAQPEYFHYLLRSILYRARIKAASTGIVESRLRLYTDDLFRLEAHVPSLSEQTAIARFLDYTTDRIDRYIRAKQKLITLMEEQKQVIVHDAVTGRIDVRTGKPYPAYKPSGVEWLGDVPAHWEVRRLRYLTQSKLTYGANAAAEYSNPQWPRYLRITDFATNGELRPDTFRSLPPDKARGYLVKPEDVLLARSGATVGKAFFVDETAGVACHAGYLIRVRLNHALMSPKLFFWFTQSTAFARWKEITLIAATIENISAERYADLPVPVPPSPEQKDLLKWLRGTLDTIDIAANRLTSGVGLLREYRTRLIADVVTGKLDVREAAAGLPESNPITDGDGNETVQAQFNPRFSNSALGKEANP